MLIRRRSDGGGRVFGEERPYGPQLGLEIWRLTATAIVVLESKLLEGRVLLGRVRGDGLVCAVDSK